MHSPKDELVTHADEILQTLLPTQPVWHWESTIKHADALDTNYTHVVDDVNGVGMELTITLEETTREAWLLIRLSDVDCTIYFEHSCNLPWHAAVAMTNHQLRER